MEYVQGIYQYSRPKVVEFLSPPDDATRESFLKQDEEKRKMLSGRQLECSARFTHLS